MGTALLAGRRRAAIVIIPVLKHVLGKGPLPAHTGVATGLGAAGVPAPGVAPCRSSAISAVTQKAWIRLLPLSAT
jgi:hypothetical protein